MPDVARRPCVREPRTAGGPPGTTSSQGRTPLRPDRVGGYAYGSRGACPIMENTGSEKMAWWRPYPRGAAHRCPARSQPPGSGPARGENA